MGGLLGLGKSSGILPSKFFRKSDGVSNFFNSSSSSFSASFLVGNTSKLLFALERFRESGSKRALLTFIGSPMANGFTSLNCVLTGITGVTGAIGFAS